MPAGISEDAVWQQPDPGGALCWGTPKNTGPAWCLPTFIYRNSLGGKYWEYLSKQIFASDVLLWLSDKLIFLFIQHVSQAASECHLKIMKWDFPTNDCLK